MTDWWKCFECDIDSNALYLYTLPLHCRSTINVKANFFLPSFSLLFGLFCCAVAANLLDIYSNCEHGIKKKTQRQFSLFTEWNAAPLILKAEIQFLHNFFRTPVYVCGSHVHHFWPLSMWNAMFYLSHFVNAICFSAIWCLQWTQSHKRSASWWMSRIHLNIKIKKKIIQRHCTQFFHYFRFYFH